MAKNAIKLIVGTAAITAAITSIQSRGKRLDNDIQRAALSIIMHVDKHHEVSLVNALVDAMPKGSRANALRDWFEKFGKCKFDDETKVFVHMKDKQTMFDDAVALNWFDCKIEPPYQSMDFTADIRRLLAKAEKRAEANTKVNGKPADKIDMDLLAKLRALVPAE